MWPILELMRNLENKHVWWYFYTYFSGPNNLERFQYFLDYMLLVFKLF